MKNPPRRKCVGVIPARYGSTRFPGKPLADIAGKPMIRRVYERCVRASSLDDVIVATDDRRIYDVCAAFGARVFMTAAEHPSGTDRVAEIACQVPADIFVNIQGDEPLISPDAIDALVAAFQDSAVTMATLAKPLSPDAAEPLLSPLTCKVVLDHEGNALYFSRALIPYRRNVGAATPFYRHVGIYGYTRDFLLRFSTLSPTPLEVTEGLEMLRALEHGFKVRVVTGDYATRGVDTPEDLAAVIESFLSGDEGRCGNEESVL